MRNGKIRYIQLEDIVKDEIIQAEEEGRNVEGMLEKYEIIMNQEGQDRKHSLEALLKEVESVPVSDNFPYIEPSDLNEIQNSRPVVKRATKQVELDESTLFDKVYGAWLGRSAGCLLGKPVEGWEREKIAKFLKLNNDYPIQYYLSKNHQLIDEVKEDFWYLRYYDLSLVENVTQMVRDDDMDYPIIGLNILEKYGKEFTSKDVAATWCYNMPFFLTYTAERVAYFNFINGMEPPITATHRNPYREWIGAQIRADIWGYIAPGNPELAAAYAFKDAALSHTKNGIYGEMFVAAMIAAAYSTDNIEEIIHIGLNEIPAKSRLAEAIRDVVDWYHSDQDWEVTLDRIYDKFGKYHWVHTINNAALVVMALLYGQHDFQRAISIAVTGGFDTDCNGATVGSILGLVLGANHLPEKFIKPLNDQIQTCVLKDNNSKISDLARRTIAIINN